MSADLAGFGVVPMKHEGGWSWRSDGRCPVCDGECRGHTAREHVPALKIVLDGVPSGWRLKAAQIAATFEHDLTKRAIGIRQHALYSLGGDPTPVFAVWRTRAVTTIVVRWIGPKS